MSGAIHPSTETVWPVPARRFQERFGSRHSYGRRDAMGFSNETAGQLAAFLEGVNSFYLATATADGKPYIQHRGGPRGFLKVLGRTTLGFSDFSGNKQYISLGRLSENNAVALFFMDYAHKRRIKLWGRARVVEDDAELFAELADPDYPARVERAILIDIDAWDVNCPQHIPQKFDADHVAAAVDRLEARISELEDENKRLKQVAREA